MSGFPINLDLTEYFDDLRRYSSIFVNLSKCKDVRDVGNHIKSVFGLEDNICLVYKKFLIPKSEDIQILQQYDLFKVQKCNFYDLPIHKTKKVNINSICDQKALNLTQSEKTIDLSCRPKQRLKANVCPSPGVSGSLMLQVESKSCSDSQITEHAISVNGNQSNPKDKSKHKKKRYLQSDESDGEAGNILDMSVKNAKRKKHSNCFSTDDGSLLSDGIDDGCNRDITKDPQKKSKRRKKHSDGVSDPCTDRASTFWGGLVCDDATYLDQSNKKKSKKNREEFLSEGLSIETNKTSVKNGPENTVGLDAENVIDYECSIRKKHKHSNKYSESKSLHNSEEKQYYSSTPLCNLKNSSPKKTSTSKICFDNKYEKDSDPTELLEEQKKRIKVEIDQKLSEIHADSLNTNSQSFGEDKNSITICIKQPTSNNNPPENYDQSSIAENLTQEYGNDFGFATPKRKRKRKHNKKKKKESRMHMLAVGPIMNQLVAQTTVAKSAPTAETSKHVFFTEDDFVEDMTVPSTPPVKSQTLTEGEKVSCSDIHQQNVPAPLEGSPQPLRCYAAQEQSSKPVTWQDQLLKLASSSSKPVVFYRNTTVAVTNKPILFPQPVQEHLTPMINSNRVNEIFLDISDKLNPAVEDFQKCNGEVKKDSNEDQSCSGTVDSCSSRKGLPDICKPLPIPNDLQNINLSDYPIIDKVVAQDLILFKVLKLNENIEPGVSKPILARVNEVSSFPDRISLQIMEGCEECRHCAQAEESGEAFTIELRWADILEPRLFYP